MKNIIDLNNNELIPNDKVGSTNYKTYIDGQLYYVKKSNYNHKELIISTFCKLLDIPCVDYKLAIKDNEYYVISKSYRKEDCQYISGTDLIVDFFNNTSEEDLKSLKMDNLHDGMENNLETIWLSLEHRYSYDESKYRDIRSVMLDILKQYFLMILIQDSDFHSMNWEIEESNRHITLAPKYDNEGAFGMEILGVSMGASPDDPFEETIDSINHFLDITAKEDKTIFLDLFNRATPALLEGAIKIVKDTYEITKLDEEDRIIKRYLNHYAKIVNLLMEKGLAR